MLSWFWVLTMTLYNIIILCVCDRYIIISYLRFLVWNELINSGRYAREKQVTDKWENEKNSTTCRRDVTIGMFCNLYQGSPTFSDTWAAIKMFKYLVIYHCLFRYTIHYIITCSIKINCMIMFIYRY